MITSRLQYFLKVLGSFNTQVDEFLLYKNLDIAFEIVQVLEVHKLF